MAAQAACLARCNGADAQLWRHEGGGESAFRERVSEACSGTGSHVVVSYTRRALQQTGEGSRLWAPSAVPERRCGSAVQSTPGIQGVQVSAAS